MTPEQSAPPAVLVRANELPSAPRAPHICPLYELRSDAGLLEAHLNNLSAQRSRRRGDVDPHLAISRAKIKDAESLEEVSEYLSPREKFAVLNAAAVLSTLLTLKSTNVTSRDAAPSPL